MTTPQPYIVQPDGWHVKKPNFYSKYIDNPMHNAVNPKWEDFERNNPPIPLTAWHKPGSDVSGRVVLFDNVDKRISGEYEDNHPLDPERYIKAFEVISNVGGEKPVSKENLHTEAKPELALEEIAELKYGKSRMPGDDERKWGFVEGYTHAIQSKELVKLSDIRTIFQNEINTVGNDIVCVSMIDVLSQIEDLKNSK